MSENISGPFETWQKKTNTEVLTKLITDKNILMPLVYLHFKDLCVSDIFDRFLKNSGFVGFCESRKRLLMFLAITQIETSCEGLAENFIY